MSNSRILVIGACGQVGTELVQFLADKFGNDMVIASDIRDDVNFEVDYIKLDVLDREKVRQTVIDHRVDEIYHLAAMLSATAEQKPALGWKLNMESLFNVLDLARDGIVKKIFWPSSIAVFGPTTPRIDTPQRTIMEPTTVYGISKQAGERWCEYYHNRWGVDVRSIRYPGLIGWKSLPGGGTTDYAVDIYHKALSAGTYECFLKAETSLPMMYMSDAVKATIDIMQAPEDRIKIRSSYNISAMSFNPEEIASSIKERIPGFEITYKPDFRQEIASDWPASIDDREARNDWGWAHNFDLNRMTTEMLNNLRD